MRLVSDSMTREDNSVTVSVTDYSSERIWFALYSASGDIPMGGAIPARAMIRIIEREVEMLCWHDWTVFRKPEKTYMAGASFQSGYWWHHEYTRIERIPSHHPSHWGPSVSICDLTCSKCHKMKLNLQKAFIKALKRKEIAAVKRTKDGKLESRRDDARKFALKYIEMTDRAK